MEQKQNQMDAVSDESGDSNNRQQQTMQLLYLEKDETGDVTFIVESERIRAHKCVLAAVSPKYKAQFYGSIRDGDEVIVSYVSAAAFTEFLELFYLEEANLTSANIEDVLGLAKQSLVEHFVKHCIRFLVNLKDVCLMYKLAIMHEIQDLEEMCLTYISEEPIQVFKSDNFLNNCDHEILLRITKMNFLNCKETDVFENCIEWAKNKCIKKNLDACKVENLRNELGDVINEIRFRSMNIEEFACLHYKYEEFFSPAETIEIIYIIGNLKAFKSNKFNQSLRNRILELNRIVYHKERQQSLIYPVPVRFSCSKAIRLRGFASAFNFNTYELRIYITNNHGQSVEYKPNYYVKDESNELNESFVNLEKPINIHANDYVTISTKLQHITPSTKKFTLAKEMELDGIKFLFIMEHDLPGILLTRLFFDTEKF